MVSFPAEPIFPQELGEAFLRGDFERMYRQTTSDFQQLATLDTFQAMAAAFNEGVVAYRRLFSYRVEGEIVQYVWTEDQNKQALDVYMNNQGVIYGLAMHSLPLIEDGALSKQRYQWPVKPGAGWTVFWGGEHSLANAHYELPNQRYAYDLIKQSTTASSQEEAETNEHYAAFEELIYAPAAGTVITVVDEVPDNVPGTMNEEALAGNVVVIHHADQEYSVLAHLKHHSIEVNEGDWVGAGQIIGQCGNSGHSSEPHLHMQLSDRPDFLYGRSIRMQFHDGRSPIRGDQI